MIERQFVNYVHDGFAKGYQKYREIYIPVRKPSLGHLLLIVGTKKGKPHNFVPGFLREHHLFLNENGAFVSEVFPCLDDERIPMRILVLSEETQRLYNYEIVGNDVYFLNVQPGKIRINSRGGRRGYAVN